MRIILLGFMAAGLLLPLWLHAAEKNEGAGHEYDNVKLGDTIRNDAKELPDELTVDTNKVIRTYDAAMFGLSYDYSSNDNVGVAKIIPGQPFPIISPDFVNEATGIPLPLNRIYFEDDKWKMTLGPVDQRQKFKSSPWKKPSIENCGLLEIIKAIIVIDPTAKFDIMVELTDKTPSQAGEIAEFLTGDGNTAWGRKRIEYGLEKPVVPAIWELGNERDWATGKIDITEYIRLAKLTMAAIRKVQPDAKFAPHAATAPWAPKQAKQWKEWHQAILAELSGEISYLAFHPYYHGHSIAVIEKYMDVIRDDIAASANPKIKIFISEHGKWPAGDTSSPAWKKTWHTTHALTGCLSVSEWFMRMLDHPEVGAMTMHALSSGPWGMFYADKSSGKPYGTGLADLFRFFKLVPFGGQVVQSKLSGEGTSLTDGKLSLSSTAILGSDGKLYLLINNRLPDTRRNIKCNFSGGLWKLDERYLFTGPEMESVNTMANHPLSIRRFPGDNKELQNVEVPGKSLNLLVLSR